MNFDLNTIKRKMLVKYPFFGSVIANVKYKTKADIQTAATDGKTIYYNQDFLNKLSIEEQLFVFSHEVCHIAFNHILRSENKDPETWNIATDAVINQFLKRDGLKMVPSGVDIEEAINYDAETLYEKLLKDKKENQESGESKSGNGVEQENNTNSSNNSNNADNKQVGHASHDMWARTVEESKEEKKESESNTSNDITKKQEELESMGEKESFDKNREIKKGILKRLQEKNIQDAMQAGNTTDEDGLLIENIGRAKALIDWRYVLRETIKYDVDWSYKHATIENGVVTPNLEEIPMPETEIVIDTSGSIDEELLKNFLRECKNILKYTKLKVGCFDTKFYGFHEIRTEKDIDNMKFVGGGGTNFDTAIHAFTKRVENKIIFTDGEASMPKEPFNCIWIVFGEKINPKGGKVIYISDDDLEKLMSINTKSLVLKLK